MGDDARPEPAAASRSARPEVAPATTPPVLLVTLDTTRRDFLGLYGDEAAITPGLDALAARGVVFDAASTTAPVTLPAHASLFTGQIPAAHGVRENLGYRLPDSARTLAEVLRAAGYRTGAVVAARVLERRTGLDQGFEDYDDRPEWADEWYQARAAADVTDQALRWLNDTRPGPASFFLWVHYFDPHQPYAPPPDLLAEARRRQREDPALRGEDWERTLYRAEIQSMDRELGRLLAEVEVRDHERPPLVVVVADHGESLGDHGEPTHGMFLYDPTVAIPLLFQHPDLAPGRREVPVSVVDVAPTILEFLGLHADLLPGQGRSLLPLLQDPVPAGGGEVTGSRLIPFETWLPFHEFGWARVRGARRGSLKVIDAPRPELFDLGEDPGEARDLWSERREDGERMRQELRDLLANVPPPPADVTAAIGRAEVAALQALGYTSTSADEDGSGAADRPDPKDMIDLVAVRDRGMIALAEGRHAAALAAFQELYQRNPDRALATTLIATTYARQAQSLESRDRSTEAGVASHQAAYWWGEAVRLQPDVASHRFNLAMIAFQCRQPDAAIRELEECLRLDPGDGEAHFQLGRALVERGEAERGAGHLREFLAGARSDPADRAEAEALLRSLD